MKWSRIFDIVWLLNKVKTISARVDSTANPLLTLHEQMLLFFNTKQGENEPEDCYLTRFNSRLKNMELTGGAHFLCSPQLLGKTMTEASTEEVEEEREKFKAMCFILRADESLYGDLLDDLKSGVHRNRDEYPKTLSGAYELLIRTRGQLEKQKRYSNN